MAKLRVYELARELNMTNKALLDKIQHLDVEVRSHMSSLDDDAVKIIKTHVIGKATVEHDEERVKPTVIRRRRKKGEDGHDGDDARTESNDTAEETETPEVPQQAEAAPSEKVEDAPEVAATPPEEPAEEKAPEAEVEIDAGVEASVEEKPKPEKSKPKKPQAKAAKIISIPVEATEEETPAEEPKPEPEPEQPVVEAAPEEAPVAEKTPEEVPAQTEEPPAEKQEADEEKAPAEPEAPQAEEKPAKGKKKGKKSTPAKIIKLAVPIDLPAKPSPKPSSPAPSNNRGPSNIPGPGGPMPPGGEPKSEDDDRGKKGRKKGKKKGAFSKKSVVEGKELYGGNRGKKGRKGGKGKADSTQQKTLITTPKAIKRRIKVDDTIVLAELAKRMGIKANEMIVKLMGMGVMATVNQTIDYDTAVLVAAEFGFEVEKAAFEEEAIIQHQEDTPESMVERAPVVTIMGHVDHGKTSLLDTIRKTGVAEGEAGGITQHIGAYSVRTDKGRITFLDTPGHEAFTAMRSRGAKVTDIVVLVVAADDGVMPQTVEAINHAKAAEVPMIVAVNKIDKPDAQPDRVKRELSEHGVLAEDWGGDVIFVEVSAKQQLGIEDLLDMILLQSEVLELKASASKLAIGHVIEAKLDAGRGPVATILVQEGTLKTGESVVCGIHYGRVRAMINDQGQQVKSAGPSVPVEVLGLSGVPSAGDELIGLKDEKDAKQISQHRAQKQRAIELAKSSRMSLEGLFEQMSLGDVKDLNLILKADVHGSIEALRESLMKLSTDEVKINVVHAATGTVTESDVSLAAVSNAIILGFNVRPPAKVHELAEEEKVDMRFYNIIYDAIKDIKNAMVGLMASTFEERILGRADVVETFVIPKVGTIAGCMVSDGKIQRGQKVRVLRDGVIIYDGNLASLRRFKDDVKEVALGYDCGIGIEKFNDIKIHDTIECYYMEEIRPQI